MDMSRSPTLYERACCGHWGQEGLGKGELCIYASAAGMGTSWSKSTAWSGSGRLVVRREAFLVGA